MADLFPPLNPQPVMVSQIQEAIQTIEAVAELARVRRRELVTRTDPAGSNEWQLLRYQVEAMESTIQFLQEQISGTDC